MPEFQLLTDHPWLQTVLGILLLLLAAAVADIVARRIVVAIVHRVVKRTTWKWDDVLARHGVFVRIARLVPWLVIFHGIQLVPLVRESAEALVRKTAVIAMVIVVAMVINAALSALTELYARTVHGRTGTIKGYMQLVNLAVYIIVAIIILSVMIDRSPLLLLSGLGALSAVLMLVFKDTILSVVASVQLSSNDMLRVGDWIEMPQFHADGDVIDIALHTVKVRNWDKTITTIPTWRLISDPYKNWRGMQESGGRRIKRALYLDVDTVGFLDDDQVGQLRELQLLTQYMDDKLAELAQWNAAPQRAGTPANQRRLTNIGTYRAYAQALIDNHPDIHQGLTRMVRQLEAAATGVPMEIYCFTATTAWGEYEGIQGDIFDHLMAIAPTFGLAVYQQPSGRDLRMAATLPAAALRALAADRGTDATAEPGDAAADAS